MDGSNPQAFKSPEKHTDGTVVTEGNIPWSLGPGFSPFSPRAVQASLALSAIFGHANETKEVDIRGNRQHAAISAAVSAASSGTVDSGGRRGTTKVSRSGRTRRAVSFDGAVNPSELKGCVYQCAGTVPKQPVLVEAVVVAGVAASTSLNYEFPLSESESEYAKEVRALNGDPTLKRRRRHGRRMPEVFKRQTMGTDE